MFHPPRELELYRLRMRSGRTAKVACCHAAACCCCVRCAAVQLDGGTETFGMPHLFFFHGIVSCSFSELQSECSEAGGPSCLSPTFAAAVRGRRFFRQAARALRARAMQGTMPGCGAVFVGMPPWLNRMERPLGLLEGGRLRFWLSASSFLINGWVVQSLRDSATGKLRESPVH